jgi:ABC-type enterochelin transport system substrate-binding protein
MLRTRTIWFCLVVLSVALLLSACGPSEAQIRARDEARSAALASEARAASLEAEYADLTVAIPQKEAQVQTLQQELAELQAEYQALGGR